MDFMDFSRRLYRWASEGVDMYDLLYLKNGYELVPLAVQQIVTS